MLIQYVFMNVTFLSLSLFLTSAVPNPFGIRFMEDKFSMDWGGGAMVSVSLAHLPLTSSCVTQFLTVHGPYWPFLNI